MFQIERISHACYAFFFLLSFGEQLLHSTRQVGGCHPATPEIIHSLPKREAAQPPPHRHTQLTCLNVKAVRE